MERQMAKGLEGMWVAEYSMTQDAFHVDTVGRSIRNNLRMVADRRNNDYLVFGVFETHEEASRACEFMRGVHERRDGQDEEIALKQCAGRRHHDER